MPSDISEEQVAATERELGARLPAAYRERMMLSNGGTIELFDEMWELVPIRDTSTHKRLVRTTNHILLETRSFQEWDSWPANAFMIGDNGCGDALVLIKAEGIFRTNIYVWRHETGELSMVAAKYFD